MLHLVKPAEDDGLEIPLSATAVPVNDDCLRLAMLTRCEITATLRHAGPPRAEDLP